MPDYVEGARQDGLQAQKLSLEDQLVDDGHQAVVQDEGHGRVQDGPVGDVHGAAAPFVHFYPHQPGRQEAADDEQEPGTGLLI